jgi:hypothetical protein
MYRFGDGTPFPLRENFIETIVAAVDCCVSLYQLEQEAEARQQRMSEARKSAADELKRLDALKALIETAVSPLLTRQEREPRTSEAAAERIFENANSIIRQSRAGVVKRRDTVVQEGASPERNDATLEVLSGFLRGHTLPRTEWSMRWQASGESGPVAEIGAQATREFDLSFAAEISAGSAWAGAQPAGDLVPDLSVATTIVAGSGRPRTVRLESFAVAEVQIAPGREAMLLRESGRRSPLGLHVVIPRSSDTAPLCVALDKRDQPIGQPFYLDETASAALHAIWAAMDLRLSELVAARSRLVSARLGGRDVTVVEHPSQIAETILLSLAPLIREMRMRSRVPGELILKRDLVGDRREELFVPRQVLWAKLDSLPPHHRQVFEAVGLSNEATFEFVTRVTTAQPTAHRSRVPLPANQARDQIASGLPHPIDPAFEREPQGFETPPPSTFTGETDIEPTRQRAVEASGIIMTA